MTGGEREELGWCEPVTHRRPTWESWLNNCASSELDQRCQALYILGVETKKVSLLGRGGSREVDNIKKTVIGRDDRASCLKVHVQIQGCSIPVETS